MTQNTSDIILQKLRDGILIVNENGEIEFANRAAEGLFGKPTGELIGQRFGYPVGSAEMQEIEIVRENKVMTVQMLAAAIRWNEQGAWLLSLRDITELKNIMKLLELQKSKLEKTNEDLEQYAYFASHDLKEPIRKIIFYTDGLINNESIQSVPRVKEQIERVFHFAKRMESLVKGIAEYSKFSASVDKFTLVDLNRIIKDVLVDLDELIVEKKVKMNVSYLPTLEASSIQMHQLFSNLISNAIKYSKKDIAPEISIKHIDREFYCEFSIVDNGIGFDDRYSDRIFQPFQRLHSKQYEGSGIGLAICKKIVEAHGGEIHVKSKPDNGTEFSFTLSKNAPTNY